MFDTQFPMQFTTAKVERKVEYCKRSLKKLPRQRATHPDYKTLVVALALKGQRITGRGGAQRNP